MVSNMELNVKRFNEKCKRNYITIIAVEYQCGTEMEGDILISAGNYRSQWGKKNYMLIVSLKNKIIIIIIRKNRRRNNLMQR